MIRTSKWFHASLAIALVLFVVSPALATVKVKNVSADQNQITVTDQDGKDWTYTLADNAKIFVPQGKQGKLGDLKAGQDVSLLWEKQGDKLYTNAILLQEGDLKESLLAHGTVKRVNADQNNVIVADQNNKEWTYHMADNARVNLGTKAGKVSDLKDGDKVIIVYDKKDDKFEVRDICADRR